MNIAVFIKQVPDGAAVRMDRERMTVLREGVESIINPLDQVALEAALEITNREGGAVTVLTMGPPQSEAALREAVALGADRAILLTDPAFAGADTLATSHVLAVAASKIEPFPDLFLCGMQTIDSDTGHVGPQVAEELDLPQVCGVNEIHREGDALVVKRLSDGFLETVRVTLPALMTVSQELCPPKDLSLGALEVAFSEENIVVWGRKELGLKKEEVGLEGSATRVWRLHRPPRRKEGEVVSGPPEKLLDKFISKLEALSLLEEEDDRR